MSGRTTDRKATVLIVDDEEYNVDYLQQNLSDLGFRTREAYGGRQALDSVSEEAPDLILLDVMMPDIDGITVCQMLKSDPDTRLIPIVIMTALDGQEDRIRGIEAGADDFLTKPVDERELMARINSLLRTKRAVDEKVEELESAATQLEELGIQHEEVTVLAVEVRSGDPMSQDSPAAAHDYLLSRYLIAVTKVIEQQRGQLISSKDGRVLAMMRSSSGADDSARAIDAALAIRSEIETLNRRNDIQHLEPAIAINRGEIAINPERVDQDDSSRWTTQVTGAVADQTLSMAAELDSGEVIVSHSAFDSVRGRYSSEPFEPQDSALKMLRLVRIIGVSAEAPYESRESESTVVRKRQLETILVSDIIGSTEIATRLGDRAWTIELDNHYQLVRSIFEGFAGEEISTAGDGFLAVFGGPANAIRAGLAICEQSGVAGLPVRVGIHTGEVERDEHDVHGIAVHLAARISAEAGHSEVLVTSTTKEAVAGSGIRFVTQGNRALKGIEGEREVFLAVQG